MGRLYWHAANRNARNARSQQPPANGTISTNDGQSRHAANDGPDPNTKSTNAPTNDAIQSHVSTAPTVQSTNGTAHDQSTVHEANDESTDAPNDYANATTITRNKH